MRGTEGGEKEGDRVKHRGRMGMRKVSKGNKPEHLKAPVGTAGKRKLVADRKIGKKGIEKEENSPQMRCQSCQHRC